MTKEQAAALVAEHGSQRAAARAVGCSHHTIARALAGQGAHRGDGYEPPFGSSGPGWQRSTVGPAYTDEDEATIACPVVVVGVVVLIAGWVAWRWWKRERERRQGQISGE